MKHKKLNSNKHSRVSEVNETLDCGKQNNYHSQSKSTTKIPELQKVRIHFTRPHIDSLPQVKSSRETSKLLREFISAETLDHKERFWVILMQGVNVLGISEIGSGSIAGVVVHISEIFQLVILSNAKNFIIAHNHPSGTLEPSACDKKMTEKILSFSKMLGVKLSDHIILTSESHYSFADAGLMR